MRLAFFLSSYCGKPWTSLWSSLCSLGISSPSLSTPGEKIKTPHNHKWQLLVATFTFTIKWHKHLLVATLTFTIKWHKHLLVATFPFHTWQQEIWPQGWKTTSTSLSMQTWWGKMGKDICLSAHLFVCHIWLHCILFYIWKLTEHCILFFSSCKSAFASFNFCLSAASWAWTVNISWK